MFSCFYNICLMVIGLIALPQLMWQCLRRGKYRSSLLARLGFVLPEFSPSREETVIWMHAVSMGEVKAMLALFRQIQAKHPDSSLVISTTTETGLTEAKKTMPEAKAHFILPLDFSWVLNRLIKQIRPSYLILCESDFWLHLLTLSKSQGAKIFLINGKISERSFKRFSFFSAFSKRLFSCFDCLCLQSKEYYERFETLGISSKKLHVTGNLKLEAPVNKIGSSKKQLFCSKLGLKESSFVLVIGSTHDPEEALLISALAPLWKKWPELKILLIPRHPERFDAVAELLQRKQLAFQRYSSSTVIHENLILIDTMGILNHCYQVANLAIVAGSYTPRVGGHNIFEPIQQGIPAFFGPWMHGQKELKQLVLQAQAGKQVPLEELFQEVCNYITSTSEQIQYKEACKRLTQSIQGATQKTFDLLFS